MSAKQSTHYLKLPFAAVTFLNYLSKGYLFEVKTHQKLAAVTILRQLRVVHGLPSMYVIIIYIMQGWPIDFPREPNFYNSGDGPQPFRCIKSQDMFN